MMLKILFWLFIKSFVTVTFAVPVLDIVIGPADVVTVSISSRLLPLYIFVVADNFADVVASGIVVLFQLVVYVAVIDMIILISVIGYETNVDVYLVIFLFSKRCEPKF